MAAERVIVIGGGFAGLLAAYRAAQRGARVSVVEASDRVGGAITTAMVAGMEVNTGAEAFANAGGRMLALVKELGLDVVQPAGNTSLIVAEGRSFPSVRAAIMGMPASPLSAEVRRALGLRHALRAALERFLPARVGNRPGITVGEFARARFGRGVHDLLVAPLVTGVFSSSPDRLELDSALPRMRALLTEHGSAQAAVAHLLTERGRSAGAGAAVSSVTPTMAEIPRALARRIRELGGTIQLRTRPERIERTETGWCVNGQCADRLIIATDPDSTRALLADALPEIASRIPHSEATQVRLATLAITSEELDAISPVNGALIAPTDRHVKAKAMTCASAKWAHLRHPGTHLIRLSYGRPTELPPPKNAFPELALSDITSILGIMDPVLIDYAITDHDRTMRQSSAGDRAALTALTSDLPPTLELAGAWIDGTGLEAITRERDAR